jgi:glucose/arabinose dehydrogenase
VSVRFQATVWSWNRKPFSSYKVIFGTFSGGKPNGEPVDVLTGFVNNNDGEAYGRSVGVVSRAHCLWLARDGLGKCAARAGLG